MPIITIPKELSKELKKRAKEHDVSMSEVARRFIKDCPSGAVRHCNLCKSTEK